MSKPRHESKTLWTNVATGVSLFVVFLLPQLELLPIPDALSVWITFGIACVSAVANIYLRLVTYEPLEGTMGERKAFAALPELHPSSGTSFRVSPEFVEEMKRTRYEGPAGERPRSSGGTE